MTENEIKGIKGWKEDDRPREKCLKHGVSYLSDAELVAILLGSGTRSMSAVELGREILRQADNSLAELGRIDCKDLCRINGVGTAKAVTLLAAFEISRRRQMENSDTDVHILSSRQAAEIFIPMLSDLTHEEFWIMLLNQSNKVIDKIRLASGGVNRILVDPKIVFKVALQHLATGIVLCHNHPGGSTSPSDSDIELTERLAATAQALEIRIIDHIIVSGSSYYSFADSHKI
ncbi:MAG: DNA repair protein RadC [Paludibacteraceae bacterium]|nr:DNA repair protein RadC [Paludibacteraceae bacterium]